MSPAHTRIRAGGTREISGLVALSGTGGSRNAGPEASPARELTQCLNRGEGEGNAHPTKPPTLRRDRDLASPHETGPEKGLLSAPRWKFRLSEDEIPIHTRVFGESHACSFARIGERGFPRERAIK